MCWWCHASHPDSEDWNILSETNNPLLPKTTEFIDTENRLVVPRTKLRKEVKGTNFLTMRKINPGDVMYSIASVVNNTILYISKFLRG